MNQILKILISVICGVLLFIGVVLLLVTVPIEIYLVAVIIGWLVIIIHGVYYFLFGMSTTQEEFKEPMDLTERDLHIYDHGIDCIVCGRSGLK